MSRCLPFPPPEYAKNGLQGEALLKQLELLRERALSKKKKKDRKRKRKHGCNGEEVRQKRSEDDKGKHKHDRSTTCREKNDKKIRKHENPKIENSTVPAELGQPITLVSVNGYSDKRKLGGIFGKEKSSTYPSQVMVINTPHKRNSKYNIYQGGCLTGKREFDSNENLQISKSTSTKSDVLETKLECRKLINLPPLQMVQTDFEDEKWWLPKKNLSKSERTQPKHDSNGTSINQGIQPRAQYLADADIYALPYVVPF